MPVDTPLKLGNVFSHWAQVRDGLLETIDKFHEDELTYRPYASAWSAGQLMLHIGEAEEGWFQYVVRREFDQWPEYVLESYPTIEAIMSLLTEIHSRTEEHLATLAFGDMDKSVESPWSEDSFRLGWIIWHVLEHEIHHRGELSLILGMLGREGLDV